MLVHKGGQIDNVQLITGVRIAEMSQLQNCSIMCTKNGSDCENEKKERESQGRGDVYIVKMKKERESQEEGDVYKKWKVW